MTAAVYRNTPAPSLSIPRTQNTAPVLEFNCLYTHDVRRKQKRWQDGFLRFHTFNKRIMVYDVPRNFIGDMHWNGEEGLQEGDEVTLLQEGVMVQVAENVGKTETDLSEIRKKKRQGHGSSSSPMRAATPVRLPTGSAVSATGRGSVAHSATTQLKHRSLNALLGAPRGPIGKARLPTQSPFEQRHENQENNEWDGGRPSKRHRTEAKGCNEAHHKVGTAKQTRQTPGIPTCNAETESRPTSLGEAQRADLRHTIDLTEDSELESALLFPDMLSSTPVSASSPPRLTKSRPRDRMTVPPTSRSPKVTDRATRGVYATESENSHGSKANFSIQNMTATLDDASIESAETNNRVMVVANGTFGSVGDKENHRNGEISRMSAVHMPDRDLSKSLRRGRVLRLTAQPTKKNKLLCQPQLSSISSSRVSLGAAHKANTPVDDARSGITPESVRDIPSDIRLQYEKRLARISAKAEARQDGSSAIHTVHAELNAQPTKISTRIPRKVARKDALAAAASASRKEGPAVSGGTDAGSTMDVGTRIYEADTLEAPDQAAASEPYYMLVSAAASFSRTSIHDSPSPAHQKRPAGAPVRYTRSSHNGLAEAKSNQEQSVRDYAKCPPAIKAAQPARTETSTDNPGASPHHQQVHLRRRSPRKKPATANLDVPSEGTARVNLKRAYQPPKPPSSRPQKQQVAEPSTGSGPWSREASDLFDWRPPEWDEQNWCIKRANISC